MLSDNSGGDIAMATAAAPAPAAGESPAPEMMTREQLLRLFSRFSFLTSLPEVKRRIADAVKEKQEAVAVTTEIQEEILRDMGIDPGFGISCLGKVNAVYENDMDLMIKFYQFVAKEEMAIDEAELDPIEFAEKMRAQQELQQQLHKQLEGANFDANASILTREQIQEIVRE